MDYIFNFKENDYNSITLKIFHSRFSKNLKPSSAVLNKRYKYQKMSHYLLIIVNINLLQICDCDLECRFCMMIFESRKQHPKLKLRQCSICSVVLLQLRVVITYSRNFCKYRLLQGDHVIFPLPSVGDIRQLVGSHSFSARGPSCLIPKLKQSNSN